MRTAPSILLAALSATALAACSASSAAPPKPLTAAQLAHRIPGCSGVTANTPEVSEVSDVTCILPDGTQVEIATFPSRRDETAWITSGGYPPDPDPVYAGCCVEGSGWAATLDVPGATQSDWARVTRAIGGREVSG